MYHVSTHNTEIYKSKSSIHSKNLIQQIIILTSHIIQLFFIYIILHKLISINYNLIA